jgi:hypothetical protein
VTISLESVPSFSARAALAAAEQAYGIHGTVSALPSERDQNFLIVDPRGSRFVLKIANRDDAPELLDFQNQAMRLVAKSLPDLRVQRIVPSRKGRDLATVHNPREHTDHLARLLTWIDGEVLARSGSRSPGLFESIGASMAKIDAALQGFAHPAMHRMLQWDLRHAGLAREHVHLLPRKRRAGIERTFASWEKIEWARLPHGVIHGDANDYNVVVDAGRMVGLLDFGDMVHSATVCDLAVALAYAMLDEQQPLAAAAQVIGAYHRYHPLSAAEQQVLFPLILSRLAMSVCYAAHNRARNPEDAYQVVTEAAAWKLLDKLELQSSGDVFTMIVDACGVPVHMQLNDCN